MQDFHPRIHFTLPGTNATGQTAKLKDKNKTCLTLHCGKPRSKHSRFCYRCKQRKNAENNPFRVCYNNLKGNCRRRAKEKGIPFEKFFDLTFEEFKKFATETEYIINRGRKKVMYHIDRRDSTKGYTLDNIRVITCKENSRKGAFEYFYPGITEVTDDTELPF